MFLLQKQWILPNPVKTCCQCEPGIIVSSKTASTCSVFSALVSEFWPPSCVCVCFFLTDSNHSVSVSMKKEETGRLWLMGAGIVA